ncbi:MAG TPA: hypothetical protein VKA48_12890 [Gammaproteobacteria bacterium]|nr:hypothetical protein [Gammaproteobacteria bacterium]
MEVGKRDGVMPCVPGTRHVEAIAVYLLIPAAPKVDHRVEFVFGAVPEIGKVVIPDHRIGNHRLEHVSLKGIRVPVIVVVRVIEIVSLRYQLLIGGGGRGGRAMIPHVPVDQVAVSTISGIAVVNPVILELIEGDTATKGVDPARTVIDMAIVDPKGATSIMVDPRPTVGVSTTGGGIRRVVEGKPLYHGFLIVRDIQAGVIVRSLDVRTTLGFQRLDGDLLVGTLGTRGMATIPHPDIVHGRRRPKRIGRG